MKKFYLRFSAVWLGLAALWLLLAFDPGCENFRRANTAVTQKDASGHSWLGDAVRAVPTLLLDPADPVAWGNAAGTVIVYLATLLGIKKVASMRKAKP